MIRIQNLNKTYDAKSLHANHVLHDISLTLPDTGFVCILGVSGCGKTSLLNVIGGLDTFDNGAIETGNVTVSSYGTPRMEAERNRSFGYIFQNYYLLSEHSVGYNVYLGLHSLKLTHKERMERVMEALKAVDMERYSRRTVSELSGGQQQRVAIARALARRPRVIFADEPTGNLDEANTQNICSLLRRISKTSLVVMVTHEERIARFYADRIITLADGRIQGDATDWTRQGLAVSKGLYAGDCEESASKPEGFTLRLLREPGAAPVALTVLTTKDQIVIKCDDPRVLTCGTAQDAPEILEGCRPVMKMEELDQAELHLDRSHPDVQGKAGDGLKLPMMFRESRSLLREKNGRRTGMLAFLIILTVVACLTLSDYLAVANMDPKNFVFSDSHVLEIEVDRADEMALELNQNDAGRMYYDYLRSSGIPFEFIPRKSSAATLSSTILPQTGDIVELLDPVSYVDLSHLESRKLIAGRMPEKAGEVVVDRWLLDRFLTKDSAVGNMVSDLRYFLGKSLTYQRLKYTPVIVGICDTGEPDIYMDTAGMICTGTPGTELISLSQLQAQCPGEYDDLVLGDDACVIIANNVSLKYLNSIGGVYSTPSRQQYTIQSAITLEDTFAKLVIADSQLQPLLESMLTYHFYIYCPDKAAMLDFINQGLPEGELQPDGSYTGTRLQNVITVKVKDQSGTAWAEQHAKMRLRTDARSIVTVTVLLLCLVMLYLLQRTQINKRMDTLAVYRLLGVPRRKLIGIFAMETLLLALMCTLPATVLIWALIAFLSQLPSVHIPLLLPLGAAAAVFGSVTLFHLLVTIFPALRLLCQPPVRLAQQSN